VPDALDLRNADFEFSGPSDVDNPNVPNAAEIGEASYFLGHGIFFNSLANTVFISLPVDPAALPRGQIPPQTVYWVRIPRDKLLDVVAIATTWNAGIQECPRMVDTTFDRMAVKLLRFEDHFLSLRRSIVPFTIGGHLVLQHTRTSAWDFKIAPRDPLATP